ncbi:hypothetical protein TTHERM_00939070 (macronuclear) [Tetrahymena thermophila SB210]|uniref:Uncharacterized protein n=1 Tax=Tetrahymena thermophila (strain SB210) TaxID=312017 RepID=Q22DN5_TETTS|nr:hypothetical protein TTHERM_00939070 [Tetrahymena thermophila SB210]EAR83419.2 hypothetical protein TTHERM_00939070 [Tetrahymena thermophila SB210]|eukprot:XP_001031082.2 hypothetical protein TTHERM_00939070 [Tetrahymena thermophila SB210]
MNFSFKDFKNNFQKDNQTICKNINLLMKCQNIKSLKSHQVDDTQSIGIRSVDDNDMIQVDTLREYYMNNEDQIEQLRRQQTADFQFKSPDEFEYNVRNPYLDDETLLAIEKVGTLSPTKIMQEIREANKEIDQYNDKINNFYENDLDTQVYMLKLQMKARMEDGLIQQRMEFKTILNQYLQFIDKLIKDKSNLSETLQFCQTENLQLRDQLHEIMNKYEETESKLKQIFIAYQEQQEVNKKEVELKEKKIAQITEQLVLQEQGVKSIRQKCGNEYQDLVNQNKEILRQIMVLNSENDRLQMENSSFQQQIQSFQQELADLKLNNCAIAQKNTQFEEIDKQFNNFIIQLAESFSKTKKLVDDFQVISNESYSEINEKNNAKINNQLSEQQQLVVKQIQSVNDKLERISQNNKNLILQNTSLIKINKELEITLEDKEEMFKKQLDDQNKNHQSTIINLQSELISSQQSLQKLQEQFDIHTKQTNIVQQLNNQLQKEIASFKDSVQQLEKDKQEAYDKIQQKESIIVDLENSILKLKDQIHKNLLTIDEIFNGFKQKENVYHQETQDKLSEIKYLKEIINKYEEEIQKFHFQNEQIQLQQINLLRSYIVNHEQAKSSKDFIDYIQNQIQNKYGDCSVYDQNSIKRSLSPYLTETVIVQKDSRNHTPIRQYNQSQTDSMKSTQIIGQQDNTFVTHILMPKKQNINNSQDISEIKKLKLSEKSGSQFSIPEIESQRLFKTDQKNSSQSLEFENSQKSNSLFKDENINQLSQVINNLKMLSDQK